MTKPGDTCTLEFSRLIGTPVSIQFDLGQTIQSRDFPSSPLHVFSLRPWGAAACVDHQKPAKQSNYAALSLSIDASLLVLSANMQGCLMQVCIVRP